MPTSIAGTSRPRILIMARDFPPDALSGAARPGRFAKFLPEFGYEPIVVCRNSPGSTADAMPGRGVPAPTSHKATALAGLVQRYLLPYDDGLPWAVQALAGAEMALARSPVAAVISTSPPVGTHLAALKLKLRHGLPWVADFRDPLWGNPFRTRRWFFPYDVLVERSLFRYADALIANTETVAEMWRRRHRGIDGKIAVIYNGFDPENRVEALPTPASGRRVLAHVGSLYGGRHPGRLFSSLVRLIRRGELPADRACVRLVGPIEESCLRVNREAVEELRGWGCLDYDGKSVPMSEARLAGARADYLLLLDTNEQGLDLQIPAKLFEYIQIGRPILAFTRRDSPTDRILRGSGVPCRIAYHGTGDDEVDREVRGLFELPSEPVCPSAWFEEQFDGRNQTRVLAGILDSVRGESAGSRPEFGPSPLALGRGGR